MAAAFLHSHNQPQLFLHYKAFSVVYEYKRAYFDKIRYWEFFLNPSVLDSFFGSAVVVMKWITKKKFTKR